MTTVVLDAHVVSISAQIDKSPLAPLIKRGVLKAAF